MPEICSVSVRLIVRFTVSAFCLLTLTLGNISCSSAKYLSPTGKPATKKGSVYVVLAVDTEPKQLESGSDALAPNLEHIVDHSDSGNVSQVMKVAWRNQHRDSVGRLPKITWFVMTSEQLCQADGCVSIFDAMSGWLPNLESWGDEIQWHYHHVDLTGIDTGSARWNQLVTFDGTKYRDGEDFRICENSLNHIIVDFNTFPTVYHAGWCWENNDLSHWLEGVIPYDLSNYSPNKFEWPSYLSTRSKEFDWSRAPLTWRPYHPDLADYQSCGDMKRYVSRCVGGNVMPDDIQALENDLEQGKDVMFAWFTHSYGSVSFAFDQVIDFISHKCDSLQVSYHFVTASEGFRRTIGVQQLPAPQIEFTQVGDSVNISVSGPIYQDAPYVVLVDQYGNYARTLPRKASPNLWTLHAGESDVNEIYAAVSDLSGHATINSANLKDLRAGNKIRRHIHPRIKRIG
jgi:hypothetical protein